MNVIIVYNIVIQEESLSSLQCDPFRLQPYELVFLY